LLLSVEQDVPEKELQRFLTERSRILRLAHLNIRKNNGKSTESPVENAVSRRTHRFTQKLMLI
jgi:hypothetical protein